MQGAWRRDPGLKPAWNPTGSVCCSCSLRYMLGHECCLPCPCPLGSVSGRGESVTGGCGLDFALLVSLPQVCCCLSQQTDQLGFGLGWFWALQAAGSGLDSVAYAGSWAIQTMKKRRRYLITGQKHFRKYWGCSGGSPLKAGNESLEPG